MNGPGSGPPSSGPLSAAVPAEPDRRVPAIASVRGRLPSLGPPWMTGGLDALASSGAQVNEEQLE